MANPLICKESDIIIVAKSITERIVIDYDYESVHDAALDNAAFVFMGHGSNHTSNSIYTNMQSCMEKVGFDKKGYRNMNFDDHFDDHKHR